VADRTLHPIDIWIAILPTWLYKALYPEGDSTHSSQMSP
jgi:hypothetical protein